MAKKLYWKLNKNDFKFVSSFLDKHKIREGQGHAIYFHLFLNEYWQQQIKRKS